MRKYTAPIGAIAVALPAAMAMGQAGNLVTFGFTDLSGSFTSDGSGGGTLFVEASATGSTLSSGDLTAGTSNADFDAGTFGVGGAGTFQLTMTVTDITNIGANGAGQFLLSDANGDSLSGVLSGGFLFTPSGLAFLSSEVSLASFDDPEGAGSDLTIDGTSGGAVSFADAFDPTEAFSGGFSLLFIQPGGFSQDFSGTSVQADAALVRGIIPAPATLGVLGLFLAAPARRRRN
ncbi:MAG: hypothetical protein AAF235_04210 [Planctomycetota bacterium]